ncbi:serine/threonine-protein kinase [bacterium]|nr:serine/threonine-protein kinase [bacterium]
MTPERWERIEKLFESASEMDPHSRAAFLEQECLDDPLLRKQVESLILSVGESDTLIHSAIRNAAESAISKEDIFHEGQQIGHYRIVRELGHGGMGTVFLAVRADDEYQKQVAIKLVKSSGAHNEILRRFRSERQILAKLDHPNIARLYDAGTTENGLPYVVMEYIEGEPIDQYADRNKLNINERLILFRKVCSAVQYAHQNLVVHRDIKPGNILVTQDGETKLLDFGIAKLTNPDTVAQAETRVDLRILTPEYASPEQVRGEQITTSSDIYSLGVLLYELLTGHRPYRITNYTPQEIEKAVCERVPEKPSTAVTHSGEKNNDAGSDEILTSEVLSMHRGTIPGKLKRRLSGDLDNIVLMALRKEPHRRYVSAEQLSEDIRRHLEGLPVLARPATLGYRTRKFFRRHKIGATTTAAVVLLLSGLIGYYTKQLANERDRARAEAAKAAQVSEFLIELFEVSDPSESNGEVITAKELLDRAAERIEDELEPQPKVQSNMMDVLGRVYRTLGLYDRSHVLLEKGLSIRRKVFTKDDPEVAKSLFNLAELLHYEKKFDEAEPLYNEALAIQRKNFEQDNLEAAKTLDLLGRLKRDKNDYDEAERLHREAMEIRRRVAGENSAEFADSLHSMGMLLSIQGDLKAAESSFRQELKILNELKKEYPALTNNIAVLFNKQGNYAEAESYNRQTLALVRKIYGDNHPFLAHSMFNLGTTLFMRGDHDGAETFLRQSLELKIKHSGESDIDSLRSLKNLARVMSAKGDDRTAQTMFNQAIGSLKNSLGNDHPFVIEAMSDYATFLRKVGDHKTAEDIFQNVLTLDRKQLGNQHSYVAMDLYNLGMILVDQGDYTQAEQLFKQALDIQRKKLSSGHPEIAITLRGLASVLKETKEAHRAEQMLREALDIWRKALVPGSRRIASTESELGECLIELKRFSEAETLLLSGYQKLKDHPYRNEKQFNLAQQRIIRLYQVWGKPAKAALYISSN